MRLPPANVILSWPKPNYTTPQNNDHGVIVCAAICITIIVAIFSVRIGTRLFYVKSFGLDDWFMIPAVLAGLGYCIGSLLGTRYGWYRHIWDLSPTKLHSTRKLVVAQSLLGLHNVAFIKISILCLYRRLVPRSWLRTVVNIMLCITSAWLVSMTVTNFLFCIPLNAYWDISYKGAPICLAEVPYFMSFSACDLFLDVVVCILPLFIIIPLQRPLRQKLILLATFAVSLLTVVSAGLRLPSLLRASRSYDLTWELYDAVIWTQIEAAVGIACASVPALKPIVARFAPKILASVPSREKSENGFADIEHGLHTLSRAGSMNMVTEIEMQYTTGSSKAE